MQFFFFIKRRVNNTNKIICIYIVKPLCAIIPILAVFVIQSGIINIMYLNSLYLYILYFTFLKLLSIMFIQFATSSEVLNNFFSN